MEFRKIFFVRADEGVNRIQAFAEIIGASNGESWALIKGEGGDRGTFCFYPFRSTAPRPLSVALFPLMLAKPQPLHRKTAVRGLLCIHLLRRGRQRPQITAGDFTCAKMKASRR
ncbi:hypothetical protein EVAR_34776_1 [Eumeta japonica]|uniref:Uncharacterized protein n=1 Tax=Eumeta variegata TaxID=151549 RepID=A0A4C1ZKD3_EUMVA|nr:hypothetical protein EVAR_34776_1 [Eumeta japonica]